MSISLFHTQPSTDAPHSAVSVLHTWYSEYTRENRVHFVLRVLRVIEYWQPKYCKYDTGSMSSDEEAQILRVQEGYTRSIGPPNTSSTRSVWSIFPLLYSRVLRASIQPFCLSPSLAISLSLSALCSLFLCTYSMIELWTIVYLHIAYTHT